MNEEGKYVCKKCGGRLLYAASSSLYGIGGYGDYLLWICEECQEEEVIRWMPPEED